MHVLIRFSLSYITGASNVILILAYTSYGAAEIILSLFFPALVKSFGHACLILIGVWLYCFIFIAYALMNNPRWFVIIEIFHGKDELIVEVNSRC